MRNQPAYSYSTDDAVPSFDDRRPLIVFDEICVLCNGFVRFVLKHDPQDRFLFTAAQGHLGQALYRHYGLPTDTLETNLVIIDGKLHEKLDSFAAVMAGLGWPWKALTFLRVLPKPVAEWLYDRIARNRYALFGKFDTCPVPTPAMRERLLT